LNAPLTPPSARNPALPQELDALVLRAMARDREARFGSIEELGEALLVFAAPDVEARWATEFRTSSTRMRAWSVAPVSASGAVTAAPRRPRSRAWIGAGAIAALLLTGAVAWSNRTGILGADDAARSAAASDSGGAAIAPPAPPSKPVESRPAVDAPVPSTAPAPPPITTRPDPPASPPQVQRMPARPKRPERPATDNGAPILEP
jgi:serine/threonine-protein kinase